MPSGKQICEDIGLVFVPLAGNEHEETIAEINVYDLLTGIGFRLDFLTGQYYLPTP
jgi:hypothetical protein